MSRFFRGQSTSESAQFLPGRLLVQLATKDGELFARQVRNVLVTCRTPGGFAERRQSDICCPGIRLTPAIRQCEGSMASQKISHRLLRIRFDSSSVPLLISLKSSGSPSSLSAVSNTSIDWPGPDRTRMGD